MKSAGMQIGSIPTSASTEKQAQPLTEVNKSHQNSHIILEGEGDSKRIPW